MTADGDVSARIRDCANLVGGGNELSRKSGIPRRSLENYLTGREPKASVLLAIARAADVRLEWLIAGDEPMCTPSADAHASLQQQSQTGGQSQAQPQSSSTGMDRALMGRIFDAVSTLYKDEGAAISTIDLGETAARIYDQVIRSPVPPEARLNALMGVIEVERDQIRADAKNPKQRKASA